MVASFVHSPTLLEYLTPCTCPVPRTLPLSRPWHEEPHGTTAGHAAAACPPRRTRGRRLARPAPLAAHAGTAGATGCAAPLAAPPLVPRPGEAGVLSGGERAHLGGDRGAGLGAGRLSPGATGREPADAGHSAGHPGGAY